MGAVFIALITAISSATFIYTKMARQTGYGNTKNAVIGAVVAAVVIFLVVLGIVSTIPGL